MKNHNFYLKFDDNRINGFFNSNNTGYFIFGEEILDDEMKEIILNILMPEKELIQLIWT